MPGNDSGDAEQQGHGVMSPHASRSHVTRRPVKPHRLLFPLAALFALLAVPLWLVIHTTRPATVTATWHGHEMVFGFALAVVAGFLATRPARAATWGLVVAWLAARVAAVAASGPLAFIAGVTFPIMLLAVTVPPLFAGAKRPENRILPVILGSLVIADVAWWAGAVWLGPQLQSRALLAAIDLIAMLLLLIAGRALRAAVGGHLERQGLERRDYRQYRYERPLAALMAGVVVLDMFAVEAGAGILCLVAASLALLRVVPWQLHYTLPHTQLWTLALGYLWLVPGLAIKGAAQLAGDVAMTGMLHGIGIGALGTLTLVMMARTATLRAHRPLTGFNDIGSAALLVSVAAALRLCTPWLPGVQQGLLWLAAGAWSCAFLLLLARLWRTA